MFIPNSSRRPQSKTPASPTSITAKSETMAATVPTRDQISRRAHELFECRGREHGKDQQDWVTAEREIFAQRR